MNTNEKGRITEAKVLARLVELGKHVLVPFGGVGRYDLLIDEGNSYIRVQCKTGRFRKGCICFSTKSVGYSSTGKKRPEKDYQGDADYFGVWYGETDSVYLVPVSGAAKTEMFLRVDIPRNNHKRNINWAKDYKI